MEFVFLKTKVPLTSICDMYHIMVDKDETYEGRSFEDCEKHLLSIDEEITKAKANEAYDALKLEFDQRIVSIKAEQKAFRTAQNGYMVIDDDGGVDVGNGLRGRALVSRDVAMALIANMLPTRTKSIKPATTYVSFPELTASLSSLNDVAKNDLAVRNAAVTTALEKQFMQQLVQQLAIKHEIS